MATNVVNVYQSGQPVTVTVTSTVAHPGWWRISLREGASFDSRPRRIFLTRRSWGRPNNGSCTPPFIDNPVWSPTQPVIADKLGLPAGSTAAGMATIQSGTQNYQVIIPASCSLQHGESLHAAGPDDHDRPHVPGQCNYHHCADMAARPVAPPGVAADRYRRRRHARCERGHGRQDRRGRGATGAGGSTVTGTGGASVTGTGGAPSGGTGGSTTAGAGGSTDAEGRRGRLVGRRSG